MCLSAVEGRQAHHYPPHHSAALAARFQAALRICQKEDRQVLSLGITEIVVLCKKTNRRHSLKRLLVVSNVKKNVEVYEDG